MSQITVYADDQPGKVLQHSQDPGEIADILKQAGVRFEQWRAQHAIAADDEQEQIIAAYHSDIQRLCDEGGYQTVDVINMSPDHPDREALRQKFLSEHTHSEDEVRFFVNGKGLFSLHINQHVYEVVCKRGDLISVPANTPHWFDMGPRPKFTAIRLFTNPEGWVANFTGSAIASQFNRLEI
ncbi:MAG: acireductone dioxygenase [Wenzhouxiangellaceae bacterium]